MSRDVQKFPCDGCGRDLDDEVYSSARYVTIDASPEHRFRVCRARQGGIGGAKKACLYAVLEKARVCPGCGTEMSHWPREILCESCGKKLDLASEIQRDEKLARTPFYFPKGKIGPTYVGQDEGPTLDALLETMARAASALPMSESHSGFKVHTTKEQAEALTELSDKLRAFWRSAKAAGFQEGRGLLLGLATGKLSIDEFAEKDVQKARDQQGTDH